MDTPIPRQSLIDRFTPYIIVALLVMLTQVAHAQFPPPPLPTQTITVSLAGTGVAEVVSIPPAIRCFRGPVSTVTEGDCSASFPRGTTVALVAATDHTAVFNGFSGDCTGLACATTLNADRNVTATFSTLLQQLNVTKTGTGSGLVTSSPPGIVCGAVCSFAFPVVGNVTLTAAANPGSVFNGFSGACSGTTCTLTVSQIRNVTATFSVPLPTNNPITVTKDGTGDGTVTSTPAGINCGNACTATFASASNVTLTASPNAQSTFTGFSGACSGTTCTVSAAAARNVTATFARQVVTLTVNNFRGGRVVSSPVGIDCTAVAGTGPCSASFDVGTNVLLTATPTGSGQFATWGGACAAATTNECIVNMDVAKTASATFRQPVVVVPGGNGSGSVQRSPDAAFYPIGATVTLTPTANANSEFVGWSVTSGCTSGGGNTCVVTVRSIGNTITPVFALKKRALTVNNPGGGRVTSSPPGIDCGSGNTACTAEFDDGTVVGLSATLAPGAVFTASFGGFSSNCTATSLPSFCNITLTSNASVTATFRYPVGATFSGNGNGTISRNPDLPNYPVGSMVTVTAVPAANSTFAGWTGGGCTGTNPACTVTVGASGNVLGASFTLKQFALTLTKAGSGSVTSSPTGINCGTGCSTATATFNSGNITLTAVADAGSFFAGWSGACTGTAACVVNLDAAKTVNASFSTIPPAQFPLTVNVVGNGTVTSSPAGINCGLVCSATFAQGTTITLTATPQPGSSLFTGWSGACSGTGTCVVTLSASQTVAATFAPRPQGLVPSTRTIDFGGVFVGEGAQTLLITLQNDSGQPVTLSASGIASPFDASSAGTGFDPTLCLAGAPIQPGASCRLPVSFTPLTQHGGVMQQTAAIQASNGESASIVLRGLAIDYRRFVERTYLDFLGRPGDASGTNFWVGQLQGNTQTRTTMTEQFLTSGEFAANVAPIVRLYFATYRRVPDLDGLRFWSGEMQRGVAYADIANVFSQAPEFLALYGSLDNRAFIERLYFNILGRSGDAAGVDFWTGQLNAGLLNRGGVLAAMASSAEYIGASQATVNVTMTYTALLARAPDQSGFDFWVNQVAGGRSIRDLMSAFLASTEYRARYVQ